jgi:transcriptional regulator with XRE-family HTH domain
MHASSSIPWPERLRHERVRRNWRQQDLADELGTTVATIRRWKQGHQRPSAYFRVKLCALFDKSAEALGLLDLPVSASSAPPLSKPLPKRHQRHPLQRHPRGSGPFPICATSILLGARSFWST